MIGTPNVIDNDESDFTSGLWLTFTLGYAVLEGHPDIVEAIKPALSDIIKLEDKSDAFVCVCVCVCLCVWVLLAV